MKTVSRLQVEAAVRSRDLILTLDFPDPAEKQVIDRFGERIAESLGFVAQQQDSVVRLAAARRKRSTIDPLPRLRVAPINARGPSTPVR